MKDLEDQFQSLMDQALPVSREMVLESVLRFAGAILTMPCQSTDIEHHSPAQLRALIQLLRADCAAVVLRASRALDA